MQVSSFIFVPPGLYARFWLGMVWILTGATVPAKDVGDNITAYTKCKKVSHEIDYTELALFPN